MRCSVRSCFPLPFSLNLCVCVCVCVCFVIASECSRRGGERVASCLHFVVPTHVHTHRGIISRLGGGWWVVYRDCVRNSSQLFSCLFFLPLPFFLYPPQPVASRACACLFVAWCVNFVFLLNYVGAVLAQPRREDNSPFVVFVFLRCLFLQRGGRTSSVKVELGDKNTFLLRSGCDERWNG